MILLIDAGNTRIKWAMLEPSLTPHPVRLPLPWLADGAVLHDALGQLATDWRQHDPHPAITRVYISNVAGPTMRTRLQALLQATFMDRENSPPPVVDWFAALPYLAGVRNGYRNVSQLGCDRFASMIGAHALFPGQALLIATCGTATTIDTVTGEGHFTGGMILPGLGLMAKSLARHTAQLPQVATGALPTRLADNTDDAILSGCLAAQAGAIERAWAQHPAVAARQEQNGFSTPALVQCLLSGGAAAAIGPQLAIAYRLIDNLVLIGLATVALWPDQSSLLDNNGVLSSKNG